MIAVLEGTTNEKSTLASATNYEVSHADKDASQIQAAEHQFEDFVQPKLKIGAPDDPYEKEADRMANYVVDQLSSGSLGLKPKKERPRLQLKTNHPQSPLAAPDIITQKLSQKKGQGISLPTQLQTKMEQSFGTDFSAVRIHADGEAIQMNQQLGARAFTYGSDVYFNRGEYQPASTEGKRLLAHELTHVVQQGELHTTDAIQRQQSEAENQEQPHVPFIFGDLTSYDQLSAAAHFLIAQIQEELAEVPENHRVHIRATEWIEGLRAWLPILKAQGDSNISYLAAGQAQLHIDEGEAIKRKITSYHQYVVRLEIRRVARKAKETASESEKLQIKLRNSLRSAYRSGDINVIKKVASIIGTVTDIGMSLHALARECAEGIISLRGLELPKVGKYAIALDKLNRGLAVINLAFSLTADKATTQLEEGMRQVGEVVGMFSSLATIAGLPAVMGLYANLYLVPLTNAIIVQISVITSHLQEDNDDWVNLTGEPLRYGIEPGEKPMWRFMVKAMKADGIHEIPTISESVSEYFFEHKERLEAGAGAAMPTTGWFFWRELHSANAQEWVYENRDFIWYMFYGNRPVPR